MTTIRLTLPWPLAALNPNRCHAHWSSLARAKKRYRHVCAWMSRAQGATRLDARRLHVDLRFVPPNRQRRDLDNLIAAMKSGLDGLADVLGVDDSRWQLSATVAEDEIGGMVLVGVTCLA